MRREEIKAAKPKKKDIETAASICARYSDAAADEKVAVDCGGKKFKLTAPDEDKLVEWLIRPLPEPTEDDSEPDDDGQEESE